MIKPIGVTIILGHLALLILWYSNIWPTAYGWELASALQLPVARISGVTMTADEYRADFMSLNRLPANESLTTQERQQMLWQKLRDQYFIDSLAARFKLNITPNMRRQLLTQTAAQLNATSSNNLTLGYSLNNFIDRIMVPWYRDQLVRRFIIGTVPNPERRALEAVVETVRRDPKQFASQAKALATTYYLPLPLERIVPENELAGPYAALKGLKENTLSEVISDYDGYHAFWLSNRLTEDEVTTLRLQELFVPSSIDDETINRWRLNSPVITFVRNLR